MHSVYVKGYFEKNLGDDLFFKILINRYRNTKFYIYTKNDYSNIGKNLINKYSIINAIENKMIQKFSKNNYCLPIEKKIAKSTEFIIQIGGSLFMERSGINWKENSDFLYKKIKKKYFILGSNFGPYITEEYKEYFRSIFLNAVDVCFREKKSYEIFEKNSNIRVASDIVFSLDIANVKIKENKKVIISVINCEKKGLEKNKKKYEEKIIELMKFFIGKGYKITLMSFCSKEGDEEEIESILNKCDIELIKNIETYYYRGKIDEALNILADSQIIVGSRFHANIKGLVLNKTIIPIAYSKKTTNVLKDLNFKGKVIEINNIEQFIVNELSEEDLSYKCNVDNAIINAQEHFKKLDEILLNEDN